MWFWKIEIYSIKLLPNQDFEFFKNKALCKVKISIKWIFSVTIVASSSAIRKLTGTNFHGISGTTGSGTSNALKCILCINKVYWNSDPGQFVQVPRTTGCNLLAFYCSYSAFIYISCFYRSSEKFTKQKKRKREPVLENLIIIMSLFAKNVQ